MKWAVVVTTVAMTLGVSGLPAMADPPVGGCPHGGPQEGVVDATEKGWVLWSIPDLADRLIAEADFFDESDRDWIIEELRVKEDLNGDDHLCTLRQVLPNDASGSAVWYIVFDNVVRIR